MRRFDFAESKLVDAEFETLRVQRIHARFDGGELIEWEVCCPVIAAPDRDASAAATRDGCRGGLRANWRLLKPIRFSQDGSTNYVFWHAPLK